MNDNQTIALIKRVLRKWTRPLGIRWWFLDVSYVCDGEGFERQSDGDVLGTCTCFPEYRSAKIRFNILKLRDQTPDQIEENVVHELAHILISPVAKGERRNDNKEMAAVAVANALLWLRHECERRTVKSKKRKRA